MSPARAGSHASDEASNAESRGAVPVPCSLSTYLHVFLRARGVTHARAHTRCAGHQAFSDLCYIGEDQGGITGIGKNDGIWEAYAFAPLAVDGCSFHNPGFFEPQKNWGLIEFASSAVLEETLRCDAAMATTFRTIRTKFDFVAEAREQL